MSPIADFAVTRPSSPSATIAPTAVVAETSDRLGSSIASYYRRDGSWERILVAPVTRDDAFAHLSVWSNATQFAKEDVVIAFDNFRVNRGRMSCP